MARGKQAGVGSSDTLVCPRHKVETPLTCVTCETPICPNCYVRTAVGLRCPVCAQGITVKIGKRRWWPFAVAGALVVAIVAVVLVVLSGGSDDSGPVEDLTAQPGTGEGGAAPGYRLVSNPVLGFSVEVPQQWQAGADSSDTTLSYAESRPIEGSLRVSVNPTTATLADQVSRLVDNLTADGGREFVRTDTKLGDVSAVKLSYLFPTSSTPGSSLATRTSYLAVHNGKIFSFQLATTDPGAKDSVFRYMASKFTLL